MTKTITVKGVGSVSAKPDYIVLTLSLSSLDPQYSQAMQDAAERIEQLEKAAAYAGFEKGALKTLHFHVDTRYDCVKDRSGEFHQVFTGYNCCYRLKLAFDLDSGRLAEVLSAIAACGAQPEMQIAFTVKDPANIREALLESAAANARQKAEILCRAAGTALGQLLRIDYNWGELNILSPTRCDVETSVMPMMAAGKSCAPEIEPDDIDLRDTAAFVWEIQ